MHRIDGPGATVDNKFTEGNPASSIPATEVTAAWLNEVQEELLSILAAAGIAPVKGAQNQVVDAIQALLGSMLIKSVAGGASVTLTAPESLNTLIKLTGALTANIDVIVPNTKRDWVIVNNTTGAFTVTVKTAAGSGVTVAQGASLHLYCDLANVVQVGAPTAQKQIQSITASVAAGVLTLGVPADTRDFRSSTLGSGAVNTRTFSALSLVVPSGATLGAANAAAARLVLLEIDKAGTIELAVVNLAGGLNLDETTLINTTAISGASTAANVIYSATARTGVPFRVVGFIDSTQATAGTYATAPSTVQGVGGQALAALSSLGYGQPPQNVTGSRVLGTTYYNTTGKPFLVSITNSSASNMTITRNGATHAILAAPSGGYGTCSFIVQPGMSYSASGGAVSQWIEDR